MLQRSSTIFACAMGVVMLSGCAELLGENPAPKTFAAVVQRSKAKDCTGAEKIAQDFVDSSGNDYEHRANGILMLAAVADDCRHDRKKTVSLLTLSARYGHPTAQQTLAEMHEPVPPPDLRPSRRQGEEISPAEIMLLQTIQSNASSRDEPVRRAVNTDPIRSSSSSQQQNRQGYQTRDSFGNLVNSNSSYQTKDSNGNLVNSQSNFQTRDSNGNLVRSGDCFQTKDSFGNLVRSAGCQ